MTDIERVRAHIEERIKEHKKTYRKVKKMNSVVSECMFKGSLDAYESLLFFIDREIIGKENKPCQA